jgi:CBS domain-containing protein
MLKLRDIMTTDVMTVDPGLSIRNAMELFARRQVGGAPVVAGTKMIGLISMNDLVQFAASLPDPMTDRRREASREPEPRSGGDGDADAAFYNELWSEGDADAIDQFAAVAGPEWNVLEEHTVNDAMTRDVRSLSPGTSVLDAAALMTDERIHRVVIMDGEEIVGIVSLTDIARAVAEHKLSDRTYVFSSGASFDDRG